MKNVFFAALLLLIMSASCRKSPQYTPDPQPVNNVTRISSGPNDYQVFEYNTQGLLTKYISQWENGTGGINKITYALEYKDNKPVKRTTEAGYTLYTYQGDLPVKAENFTLNNKKLSTILFHFSQLNRLEYIIEQSANPQPENAEETKVSYQYFANGNVSRMDFAYRLNTTDPFVIDFSKIFEYDNKINPVPDAVLDNFLTGFRLYINNPVKMNSLDGNGNLLVANRYEYTYNEAGFPIQKKQFITTGTVEQPSITFHYSY